jgi:outer membrane protein assembly factor BamB
MKRHAFRSMLTVFGTAAMAIAVQAFDWPQWQGPDRNAISKEAGLLQEWPKEGPPLAWKVGGLGGGDSTPSVASGRIYGMSHRGSDEFVWALSERDGKEIWAVRIAPAHPLNWPQSKEGPSATPTVDGDRLYVMGLAGNVACLQTADGKVVWQRNVVADFGGRSPMWSFRESPLVDGDKVICTPGGEESTIVALNKLNGETIWKGFAPDRAGSGGPQNRGPGGGGPSAMQTDLVLVGLDKDRNKEISADEIANAPTALSAMDKNQDGKLSEDEVSPQRGDGGSQGNRPRPRRGPGIMRMMKANSALDADESGTMDEAEIKNAAVALRKLDANRDGKLTEEEAGMKFMGPQNTGAAYSSVVAIDLSGQRHYVQFLGMAVAGFAAADGKLLWRYDKPANGMRINISTPIYHDGHVFAASAYGAGGGLARLSRSASGEYRSGRGLVLEIHGEPSRWRDFARRSPVRSERREWRRVPRLPRLQDG